MEEINLRNYAYLGDAVWEIFSYAKRPFVLQIIQKNFIK